VVFKQVAFKEDGSDFVSKILVGPRMSFTQMTVDQMRQGLGRCASYKNVGTGEPDIGTPNGASSFLKSVTKEGGGASKSISSITCTFSTGLSIYATKLGGTPGDVAKAKAKGKHLKISALPGVYFDVLRPHLMTTINEMFGKQTGGGVILNEQATYDNTPSITGSFTIWNISESGGEIITNSSVEYNTTYDSFIGTLASTDFSGVKTVMPKTRGAIWKKTVLSTDPEWIKKAKDKELDVKGWVLVGDKYSSAIIGQAYNSDNKKIWFTNPMYAHTISYFFTLHDEKETVENKVVSDG